MSDRGRWQALLPRQVPVALALQLLFVVSSLASSTFVDHAGASGLAPPAGHPTPSAASAAPATAPTSLAVRPSLLDRSLGHAFASILPRLHRPAASPIPNITGTNITGFLVSPFVGSLTGNVGLQMQSAIFAMASGANSTTYMFSILGESLSTTSTAFVGYLEGTISGFGTIADPLYLVLNGTTLTTCGIGGLANIMMPGATIHTFTMSDDHGNWWTFQGDGKTISGGGSLLGGSSFCSGNGNGTVELGGASAPLGTVPLYAWLIPGNVSGVATATVATVEQYETGGSWTHSQFGELLTDSGIGVKGYLQDPTIPPDSVIMDEHYPILTPLTTLWSSGPLPALSLSERGINASMASGSVEPFKVWVNGSGGTASVVSYNSSAGKVSVLGAGPAPGEMRLSFRAPIVSKTTTVTLVLNGTAPGYVGAKVTLSVNVAPGKLSIGGPWTTGHILSNATQTFSFWVNSSFQGGPPTPVSPGEVAASVRGGGSAVLVGSLGSPLGFFPVQYTAPLVLGDPSVTITLSASGPGFLPATANLTLSVWPQPLVLSAPASATFSPGTQGQVSVPVSSTTHAVPGGRAAWWNVTVEGTPGTTPLTGAPQVVLVGTTAEVALPISGSYVGPLSVQLTAAGLGFNATSVSWSDEVQGVMELSLSSVPPSLSSGSVLPLTVTVTSSAGIPLAGSLVVWTINAGLFQGANSATADSYTGADGTAQVNYVAPSVGATFGLNLSVSVTATYYAPASVEAATSVTPAGSNGLFSGAWTTGSSALLGLLVLVAAVELVLIFLERGRASRRPSRGSGTPGAFARSSKPGVDAEIAPVPGVVLPDEAEPPADPSEAEAQDAPMREDAEPTGPASGTKTAPPTEVQGASSSPGRSEPEEDEPKGSTQAGAGQGPAPPEVEPAVEISSVPTPEDPEAPSLSPTDEAAPSTESAPKEPASEVPDAVSPASKPRGRSRSRRSKPPA